MADQEKGCPPKCGYGLLGLCCTACLLGPCRRSPFDEAAGGRYCGQDSDWIVAHNLTERVSRESLPAMAALRDALERASGPGNRMDASRLEEMKLLLFPFFRGKSALLEMLYPARAFPFLHALKFTPGSWSAALLDAAAACPETRDIDAQLESALRLSALTIAAEALMRELAGTAPGGMDLELPETPTPLLLLISDADAPPDEGRDAMLREIEAACRETVRIVKLRDIGRLPAIGRAIYDRWGIPASLSGSLAVVASPSMIRGLGALALGFSLAPLPGYPLQGSPRIEKYLTNHLKETFGHAYLPLHPDEEPGAQIMRGLLP
ncbi:MAG: hypothetical protein ACYC5X_05285 [Syntrophales bacterium]